MLGLQERKYSPSNIMDHSNKVYILNGQMSCILETECSKP